MAKESKEKVTRTWVLVLTSVASFIVAPIAGSLVNRIGERPLIAGGLLLQAVGMAWIGLIASPDLAYINLVAPLIIAGCGVSMAMPAVQNVSVSSVVANEIGKASSIFNMLGQFGGVFGIAVLVAVFARIGSYGSPQTFSNGFVPAMGVSAALSLVGAIAGLILPGRGARTIIQTQAKAPETGKRESSDALEQSPSL